MQYDFFLDDERKGIRALSSGKALTPAVADQRLPPKMPPRMPRTIWLPSLVPTVRGLFGHGFDHALAALGAEDRVLDRLAEPAFLCFVLLAAARGRRLGLLDALLRALGQQLGGRFAVDRSVVAAADRLPART